MYLSVEYESPVVALDNLKPVANDVFQRIWMQMVDQGWESGDLMVKRPVREYAQGEVLMPFQMVTTDTGPTVEIITSPEKTIQLIDKQLQDLTQLVNGLLQKERAVMLGSGVHPTLGWEEDDYYRYRTPRLAYDYAIKERGWQHSSVINIAATQEIIDLEFEKAIRVLRLMHRLSGLFIFLCRNDPDYYSKFEGRLSIRPHAWKSHVPESDRERVWLPSQEVNSWADYLSLLWDKTPMFLIGTKNSGLAYIRRHPSFWKFISANSGKVWAAKTVSDGSKFGLQADMTHVQQSDWSYMGLARLRWQWKDGVTVAELVEARQKGKEEEFLAENLTKVLLENRSSATAPPGQELASLALVTGLVANLDDAERFSQVMYYENWKELATAAEVQPLDSRDAVLALCKDMLAIAKAGLQKRGLGEDSYLEPLMERVETGLSPSEIGLGIYQQHQLEGIITNLRIR